MIPPPSSVPRRASLLRGVAVAMLGLLAVEPSRAATVEDTDFSVKRGFFEAPFTVAITSATPGARIRYTTDGSAPTESHGMLYERPVIVNTTTTLRAIAFKDGLDPTNVDTQTYLFLDDVLRQTGAGFPADWGAFGTFGTEIGNHPPGPHAADYAMDPEVVDDPLYAPTIKDDLRAIPTLSVVLNRDDLFSSQILSTDGEGAVTESRGIYPIGKGFERAASVELILPDGSSGFQINGSLEIQGATSTDRWKTAKLSMRLKFKAPYGPSELDYPLFGDDATDSVNTVILDSTNQQSWTHPITSQQLRAQYIRDQFVGDLQNGMGGLAPHGRHAHLYLNGLYWGVYWLHEFIEEAFCVAYRGGTASDYDILRHRADLVVAGTNASYLAMFAAAENDLAVPANYQAMLGYLDIPQFADYMLVNYYAGNADWAFQNWNASFNHTDPTSRWLFHNWDGEKTFQDVNDDSSDFDNEGAPTHLHQRLRLSEDYRLAFADRVHRHCFNHGILTPAVAAQKYLDRLNQIDRAIVGESARWGDNRNPENPPYTRATWIAERDRLLTQWFPGRTAVVLAQLRADGLYPATEAPVFSQHGGTVAAGFALAVTNPNGAGTIRYTTNGSDPKTSGTVYSGPVVLSQSTRVKARVRNATDTEWSALNEAVFTVPSAIASLRVTEIMFNPAKSSPAEVTAGFTDADAFEFIEIRNTSASTVNLEGVTFTEGIAFTFPPMALAAGASVIVVNDRNAFETRYGVGVAMIAGEFGGSLANAGEAIALTGGFGEAIQSFTFSDEWHPLTDGGAYALVILDANGAAANWNLASGWRPSAYAGGSPGQADPVPAPLRVTELHYHPEKPSSAEVLAGFATDREFEFIEIENIGSAAVNLNGATLGGDIVLAFGNVNLAVGARVVVVANASAFVSRYGNGPVIAGVFPPGAELGNGGGRVLLTGPIGETIHDFSYDDDWYPASDGAGASLVARDAFQAEFLWGQGAGWRASSARHGSPGASDPPEPPALRITEIMFNPAEPTPEEANAGFTDNDDFDYLELRNTGATPLNLNGYELVTGVTFVFGNVTLPPGGRVLVVEDGEALAVRYGPGLPVLGSYGGGLDNNGERLRLTDAGGGTILDFSYGDNWYPSTDGVGKSLEIIDETLHPVLWNEKESWRASEGATGSPGADSSDLWAWRWSYFSEEELADDLVSGVEADPDEDSYPNLLEYKLGLDPRHAETEVPWFVSSIDIDGAGYLLYGLPLDPLASDATLSLQVSGDLMTWSPGFGDFEPFIVTPGTNGPDTVIFRDLFPFAPGARFVRSLVTQP